MTAANRYYDLKDKAHALWIAAQNMISTAEDKYDLNNVTQTEQIEWYETLEKAHKLQEQAIELVKSAAQAQVDMWFEKEYASEIEDEKEYQEQMIVERPS
jgi:hypothetical protein